MRDGESKNDLLKQFEPAELESLDELVQTQVQAAREIFNELHRLVKSITLYGAQHQSSLNFRARFFDVITKALVSHVPITVEFQTYAIVIADQIIYEDERVEGNFIYRFYNDGIRELTFKPGIKSHEIDQLLNLFFLDWSSPELFEDDAVTVLWEQHFEHISYSVATRYDEDTQEAEDDLFNLTHELNRLSDSCDTALEGITLPRVSPELPSELREQLLQLEEMSQRELLDKLISLAHETESGRELQGGLDRFVQLLDQLAQLFVNGGEVSALERLMRQALGVAQPRQRAQLIERWAVPVFVQRVMSPLYSADHPEALSSLACLSLLGDASVPHIARALGDVAEGYLEQLGAMMSPHLERHIVELCRVIRSADFGHCKRLLPLIFVHPSDELSLKVFETGWSHEDQGVRYESLLGLPDRLHLHTSLSERLIGGISDSYSKTRTLACFRLSKHRDASARRALREQLEREDSTLDFSDQRKLYAALALMGEASGFFSERLKRQSAISFKSLGSKVKEEQHCALVGLALSSSGARELSTLEQYTGGGLVHKLGGGALGERLGGKRGGALGEPAQWGVRYINAPPPERDQMIYELFFRGQLMIPRERSI